MFQPVKKFKPQTRCHCYRQQITKVNIFPAKYYSEFSKVPITTVNYIIITQLQTQLAASGFIFCKKCEKQEGSKMAQTQL
jgi:hypothetical protein